MITDVELPTAVGERFPSAKPRPTLDCPAFDVSATEVVGFLEFLQGTQGYDFLMDLTAVDGGIEKSPRFTVVWHLYSSTKHCYVRIATDCASDLAPVMPTATRLWAGADWHEREAFDMFGITFADHPDLRRILMWDGYPYHPLRKEFPLAGLPADFHDPEITAETKTGLISAPMAGGPFVATPGEPMSEAEPRAKDEAWSEQREKPE